MTLILKKDKKADGIKMELKPKTVNLDLIEQTYGNHYIKEGKSCIKKLLQVRCN